ncbi:formylglycine-generating enzyme family protein [Sphingopyxis sp. R3-92]|uniref:formylglycine-generating enzyme family protein n=1 Tax=Sphingopyxis sp. R3-92 TaxID=3158553 RepID=UPI003EE53A08
MTVDRRGGLAALALLLVAGCASLPQSVPHSIVPPEMAPIAGGTFAMGTMVDRGYGPIDGPTHDVEVASFSLARREVTVGEFRAFVKDTGYVSAGKCNVYDESTSWHIDPDRNWERPGFAQGEDHPVLCVSWRDTQAYIAWLNGKTGRQYRLPSEAEWEYVAMRADLGDARGGGRGVTHDAANIGKVECCGGKTEGRDTWIETAPVGSFPADRLGLYDIRGNVWEWQADCYHQDYVGAPVDGSARQSCPDGGYHAIRGGSYGDAGEFLEERFRLRGPADEAYFTVGFRLAHPAG